MHTIPSQLTQKKPKQTSTNTMVSVTLPTPIWENNQVFKGFPKVTREETSQNLSGMVFQRSGTTREKAYYLDPADDHS